MVFLTLPDIPGNALQREFFVDDARLEVTSMDIVPHGAFFVAGCSNGMVLLFDLTEASAQRNGILLAQIRAKGMHTNLRLTVKLSDDSRMCFAGVMKGSSEMFAIDLSSYLVDWSMMAAQACSMPASKNKKSTAQHLQQQQQQSHQSGSAPSSAFLNNYFFETFTHSDAKLRGFGAAATIPLVAESSAEADRRYLLACGMGIKNIHVWQLMIHSPSAVTASASADAVPLAIGADGSSSSSALASPSAVAPIKRDEWSCIYDVASNGMTITHLGFRNAGRELLTKSAGVNIRVWDLSKYTEEPTAKPSYEDIPNTHDVRCLLESSTFTYGGTYEFSMVKVDKNVPKEANRNVFELPERPFQEEDEAALVAGLRRRRTMREVQDIIGTQDGAHVMILCEDGGVMYYRRSDGTALSSTTVSKASDDATTVGDIAGPSSPSSPSAPRLELMGDFCSTPSICPSPRLPLPSPSVADDEQEQEQESKREQEDIGALYELSHVQRTEDVDQCWALKRIGANGNVVLLRAVQALGKESNSVAVLSVSLLSKVLSKEASVPVADSTTSQWHPNMLYFQSKIVPPAVIVPPPSASHDLPEVDKPINTPKATAAAATSTGSSVPKKKKPPVAPSTPTHSASGAHTPTATHTPGAHKDSSVKPSPSSIAAMSTPQMHVPKRAPKLDKDGVRPPRPTSTSTSVLQLSTPSSSGVCMVKDSQPGTPLPRNQLQQLFADAAGTTLMSSESAKSTNKTAASGGIAMSVSSSKETAGPRELYLGTMPKTKRTLFAANPVFVKRLRAVETVEESQANLLQTFNILLNHWTAAVSEQRFLTTDIYEGSSLSQSMLSTLGGLLREQFQLHRRFVSDVTAAARGQENTLLQTIRKVQQSRSNTEGPVVEPIVTEALVFLPKLIAKYQSSAEQLLQHQQVEFNAAKARQAIDQLTPFSMQQASRQSQALSYKYQRAFSLTFQLKNELANWMLAANA